jgi:hypothetical protein
MTKLGEFTYSPIQAGVWGIIDPLGRTHKIECDTEKEVKDFIENFDMNDESYLVLKPTTTMEAQT